MQRITGIFTPFQPPAETLTQYAMLLSRAVVVQPDLDDALADWKDSTPNPKFRNILEAEEVEGDSQDS